MLFRESGPRRFRITGPVILTYLFVSVLHGLWDGLPSTVYLVIPPGFNTYHAEDHRDHRDAETGRDDEIYRAGQTIPETMKHGDEEAGQENQTGDAKAPRTNLAEE